jgi:hypothetical protein
LETLEVQRDQAWHNIVTLDEPWFHLTTDHESIWFPSDEKVPERQRHMIQSKKFVLTIVWNPSGFLLVNVLPMGHKFNSDYYITDR